MTRRWIVNGRFLAQPVTGVQRYAHEIVTALDRLMASGQLLTRDLEIEVLAPPNADHVLALKTIPIRRVGYLTGHAWEQAALPTAVASGGLLSFCNTGPITVGRQIVCIHDTNVFSWPQSYSLAFRALYRQLLPRLGRSAANVATVSHYSAGELVTHGVATADRILVAPNGHDHAARWRPAHSAATRAIAGRDLIVMIGSPAPHKNMRLMLDMAERLKELGLRIAIVGMSNPRVFSETAMRQPVDNVLWLGRLSDAEMAALLKDSLCLAFPSFVEGFGLPPLEAMALGCPVVVSDRASLPEICADAALYAAPDDADAWLDQFRRLLMFPALRLDLAARGRARAGHFRWEMSAEAYLLAMARADGHFIEEEQPRQRAEVS
ncbi:glycosyltransferase family 4 protein [Pararhizobium haloflavum]|uniref:glycosyltransferase family 4 protein n=1 Tax=Pararhizobium haloflavum TaxID=2037914 RepID=UPI000C1A6983|nr:glycosyltransferase family 1 protein [Pararhizobium haloflavum]